jgi:hypothetical protein
MPRHVTSIKCGSCKGRHDTVAQVSLCYTRRYEATALGAKLAADIEAQQGMEAAAEAAAELRNEQWFEERGGAVDDPRERELWALEDMRADAIIQANKDATLALLERWCAANPGRQLNGYACTPYSRCNCPRSYARCSAFAVLERFEAAAEPRSFSMGRTRRGAPWAS